MDIHACTVAHPLPGGSVRLLGASRTVTGAMTRVELGSRAVLVDCGQPQGRDAQGWSLPDGARDVSAVLLTHGHNDHVGALPELLDTGYRGPILGTAATLEIARIVLADGVRLAGGSPRDVAEMERLFAAQKRAIPYDERGAHVPRFPAEVTFREAGHILGSACVELRGDGGRVICSGDLGRPNSPILRDYNTTWSDDRDVDLVVMESTYGDVEHRHDHAQIEANLLAILQRARSAGGHILVPAFAIGRTQTLLYHLNNLVESGRCPRLPVAVDTPMGILVTETYQQFRTLFDREALDRLARGDNPLDFENLFAVRRGGDSVRLRDVKQPMLIIAGSGMVTGGRIIGHMKELLPRRETTVLFVGFQAPGTPGRRIQEAARGGGTVRLDGEDIAVRATVDTLAGLSAHADRAELKRWLHAVPRVRRVALNHGEADAQEALKEHLEGRNVVAAPGRHVHE